MCARVVCRGRGGAAWQTEAAAAGAEEGSRRGGGRSEEVEEVEETGEGEGGAAPTASPGARSEAGGEERCACRRREGETGVRIHDTLDQTNLHIPTYIKYLNFNSYLKAAVAK